MAAAAAQDALLLFRTCISSNSVPIPTTSSDPSSGSDIADLPTATHILFNTTSATDGPSHTALPASTPTRFISGNNSGADADFPGLDLLSVFWCWENKDKGVGEYISATQTLNASRAANNLPPVTNLVFAEKLDLVNWLSGDVGETESEFIRPLGDTAENRRLAGEAADLVKGDGTGDVIMGGVDGATAAEAKDREMERLKEIYAQERKMGDRNTVLRGIKPTDFSHVRKYTAVFLKGNTTGPNTTTASKTAQQPPPTLRANPSAPTSSKPNRKPEPIILLSPSASSLLRLANIKSFLVDGIYTPPTTTTSTSSISSYSAAQTTNMLQISRLLPSIDPLRPTRFILVESPENFKPDYWNRVVAVFTTGQAWQFKGYKWAQPQELFARVQGIHVGWRGEEKPSAVKGWGRGVMSVGIEYWREGQQPGSEGAKQRWRDREVVEEIWSAIEASMRNKGFGR